MQVEFGKTAWTGPVSNESVPVTFKQSIGADEALRTGNYSKTLTFTLSTTTPARPCASRRGRFPLQ